MKRSATRNNDGWSFDYELSHKNQVWTRSQRRNRTPDCGSTPRFGCSDSNSDDGFKKSKAKVIANPLINTTDSEVTDESINKLEEEFNEMLNKMAESNLDEGYNSILFKLENDKI